MATLFISEYAQNAKDSRGFQMDKTPLEPAIANQTVTVATEAKSAAFNADTTFIVITTDTACNVLIGADPTADVADRLIPVNVPVRLGFGKNKAAGLKLSVIVAA